MTRIEYDLLWEDRPDLQLPSWMQLYESDKQEALRLTRVELIARRVEKLMTRDRGVVDRVIGDNRYVDCVFHVREK